MQETNINNLSNHLLIALSVLQQSIFEHSVSLICRHDEYGAMGLIINKITNYHLGDILTLLKIAPINDEVSNIPIFYGGPVHQERGFILHSPIGDWKNTLVVNEDVGVTSSKDIIEAIVKGNGPEKFLITLGCAGWSEKQLERELLNNSWITAPSDNDILFAENFDQKWWRSAEKIGVDPNKISQFVGSA